VNEQVAINRDATAQAFAATGVEMMRGDWTDGDPVITAFLERQGRSGVPCAPPDIALLHLRIAFYSDNSSLFRSPPDAHRRPRPLPSP